MILAPKHLNTAPLQALLAYLQSDHQGHRFNMASWGTADLANESQPATPENICGTAGCLAGTLHLLNDPETFQLYATRGSYVAGTHPRRAASKILGLDPEYGDDSLFIGELFEPYHLERLLERLSKEDAINTIEQLLRTGVLSWETLTEDEIRQVKEPQE